MQVGIYIIKIKLHQSEQPGVKETINFRLSSGAVGIEIPQKEICWGWESIVIGIDIEEPTIPVPQKKNCKMPFQFIKLVQYY